jgi:hypothetical protein
VVVGLALVLGVLRSHDGGLRPRAGERYEERHSEAEAA